MPGQLGLEQGIVRSVLGQFFQRPFERCGFGDDPGFAGAVRGERERLDQRGHCFALVTLLGMSLRQLDVQIRDLAILQKMCVLWLSAGFPGGLCLVRSSRRRGAVRKIAQ
jgi:hypothetical protein